MRIVCFLLGFLAAPLAAQHHHADRAADADPVPLYANLGRQHRAVTTSSALAQQYFDQGLRLTYGFGHPEAIRSFREAIRQDSTCAMCWWGVAWAMGPYINATMDSASGVEAWTAVREAVRYGKRATPAERALIDAMAARYVRIPDEKSRALLDSAYAGAMRGVVHRFPDDLDAATLFAEALMVLRPWDQWTRDGKPRPGTEEVLSVLESVLARDISHPGACHLYIHATEASADPGRAALCADRLAAQIPGASHIQHMPSHTYMRIGRYGDGVRTNLAAWHVDQQAAFGGPPGIYPTHNLHMLLFAATMDGQSAIAIQAARDLARISPAAAFYPDMALARFGRWEELREQTGDPADSLHLGVRRFARGVAWIRGDSMARAEAELAALDSLIAATGDSATFRGHKRADLLALGRGILAGELYAARGHPEEAILAPQAALPHEDSLDYDEPEPWMIPVRHVLGAVLLKSGDAARAEAVYRDELRDHPANGWSLFGLEAALRAQGRLDEAADTHRRFEAAWARSDLWIRGSRF
ncbi:MAG: tetratricopeptide repeat protein [Gemmatimonadales bacterium]